MDIVTWIDKDWLPWVLPPLIFCARICDVTVGTLRIVSITRGMRFMAMVLGFFEVFIWLVIVSQVLRNVNNIVNFFAYAGGYATGNYIGMYIENKLAFGASIVRIITSKDASELIAYLKANHYGFTHIPAYGNDGKANIIFTVIKRKNLPQIIENVKKINPRAFFSVEDVRTVNEGIFPADELQLSYLKYFR